MRLMRLRGVECIREGFLEEVDFVGCTEELFKGGLERVDRVRVLCMDAIMRIVVVICHQATLEGRKE